MATTFLEPGGDADFNAPALQTSNGFWGLGVTGAPAVATDFVHGNHQRSIKYRTSNGDYVMASTTAAGSRISMYLYINALPTASAIILRTWRVISSQASIQVKLTSSGVLQLFENTAQIGSNGSTLSTGVWYRISLAYTMTSTTVNEFRLFKNGALDISVTNATLTLATANQLHIGNISIDTTLDLRTSDHYEDNLTTLVDTGDIWVTAKRPNANGTTNGFTTQIGSGGSGYGTGHSSQVNERPLSTTNGWSMVGAGSAITEEYNIEGQGVGDITTVGATIVDYVGWVSASAALAETGSIIVNNVTSNVSLTSTNTVFTKVAGSTTYPAGTGTDIGLITSTTVTTVSLYECGILVAFIPASTSVSSLSVLGAG